MPGAAILTRMFRTGFDARLPAYHQGGISTWIREVTRALAARECAHHLTIFESRKVRTPFAGRHGRARLWTPCHHRLEALTLGAELLPHRLDLLHSPDFIPPLFGARRHVITICDLNFLHFPEFLTRASRRHYNGQIRRAARQAHHIVTISQASERDIVELLDVPPERITVQHPGIADEFRPPPADTLAATRRQLDLPDAFFLFVGTFEPRKNIAGLLEAWRRLQAQLPDAPPVVLAGRRGWLFDDTMQRIQEMQLENYILWREDVPQRLMPALFNLATALVLPSHYEGFGFPALEAMACGTVPLVSNRSSLPEVTGDVGLQVDPNDPDALAEAMLKVLTDSTWREAQVAAGLQRAAGFTWDRSASAVLAAWQRALQDT